MNRQARTGGDRPGSAAGGSHGHAEGPGDGLGNGPTDGPPDAPVFDAPWQAQAFAMVLALHRQGLFTWPEWAQALARQIRMAQAAGDPDRGDTYYQHWLAALEALVAEKGATDADELQRHARAWARAAARTPHGQPIEPQATDLDGPDDPDDRSDQRAPPVR